VQRRLGAARRRMEGRRLARLGHSDTGSGKEGPRCRCEVERPTSGWRFTSSATVASSSEFSGHGAASGAELEACACARCRVQSRAMCRRLVRL
jgi:hypothetical protein